MKPEIDTASQTAFGHSTPFHLAARTSTRNRAVRRCRRLSTYLERRSPPGRVVLFFDSAVISMQLLKAGIIFMQLQNPAARQKSGNRRDMWAFQQRTPQKKGFPMKMDQIQIVFACFCILWSLVNFLTAALDIWSRVPMIKANGTDPGAAQRHWQKVRVGPCRALNLAAAP